MNKLLFALVVVLLTPSACSGSDDEASAELERSKKRIAELEAAASTTTVDETPAAPETTAAPATIAPTTAAPTTAAPTTAAPATAPPTTAPQTTATPAPSTAAPAPQAAMPDVVCLNLQAAQDRIQSETGIFLSLSEDASGAGRNQLLDSNWIVVAQRPAPGTPFGEGDAVLSAVKLDEPNDC